jgi:hypothetical protein
MPSLENQTAETIAAWFFERIANCERVRVFENDDCLGRGGRARLNRR